MLMALAQRLEKARTWEELELIEAAMLSWMSNIVSNDLGSALHN
jgi:hypothetical protein